MEVLVKRVDMTDEYTYGILYIDGVRFCVTLERPYLDNRRNVSCIPFGRYKCKLVYSPSFKKELYEVQDVRGRTNILMHNGNYIDSSAGCLLLGEHFGILKNKIAILDTNKTLRLFMANLSDYKEFNLIIKEV